MIVAVHTDPELYTIEIIIKDDSLVGGADHDVVDLTPDQFVEIPGFPDQPFPPSQSSRGASSTSVVRPRQALDPAVWCWNRSGVEGNLVEHVRLALARGALVAKRKGDRLTRLRARPLSVRSVAVQARERPVRPRLNVSPTWRHSRAADSGTY